MVLLGVVFLGGCRIAGVRSRPCRRWNVLHVAWLCGVVLGPRRRIVFGSGRTVVLGARRSVILSPFRSFVRLTCLSRCHHSVALELIRALGGRYWRFAVILRRAEVSIVSSLFHVSRLRLHCSNMSLSVSSLFFRVCARLNASASSVVTHAIVNFRHSRLVHIVDNGNVHVCYRAIIEEVTAVPAPPFITVAEISESIADSAVETDGRSPVTCVENECAAAPTP